MAVMRSYIISVRDAENQPYIEAQFYSAVMQCDANKVKEIIKKDPDIFYKTYDGIALHELPKLLVESGYDKYVDANFKKGGKDNKNNYSAINGIVSEGYKRAEKARVRNIEVLSTRDSASYHTDL
jgi:hypothetical protein